MSYREVCRCGHDKATHYRDPVTKIVGACTGFHCNDCKFYRDENDATPSTLPPSRNAPPREYLPHRKPHADPKCACKSCFAWARRVHSLYCTCPICWPV